MQSSFTLEDFKAPCAEWKTERLHSWKEIASFFRREVRTVQLWEKSEGLPVRRQHHKKLGSVYAYRRELESWWIARSKLSAQAAPSHTPGKSSLHQNAFDAGSPEIEGTGFDRILLFAFEVVHSQRQRGPFQETVDRFAGGLKDDVNLELSRSRFNPICLAIGALPSYGASTPGFMRNVAREFGADFYLTGAIRCAGNLVRTSIQLVRTSDSVCLWSERFDITLDDVFHAQAELARRIVQALPEHVMRRTPPSQLTCSAEHTPAFHACMMGLHFWRQRTRADLVKALGYFQDAILIDPSFADAYAGLTDTYVSLSYSHLIPARQAMEAAQRAVETALTLDPKSIPVRNAEINFKTSCTWDWQVAERACQKIVDSGQVDARTLQLYAALMTNFGRHDEAISLALHAHRIDPLSDSANSEASFAYFYAGDYDRAISFVQRTIALKPRFSMGHALLGRAEAQRGNWDKAIESFERGLSVSSDPTFLRALLAYGYAGRGDAPAAHRLLREIEVQRGDACFPAVDVSAVYAMLDQPSEALRNIFRAYELRDIKVAYIQYDPRFTRLRALPQFRQIASSLRAS